MYALRLLRSFLLLALAAHASAQVVWMDDRENTAPTPWFTYGGQTVADIGVAVASGLRPTDLKVDDPALGTFTVCYVANAGVYQRPFWWQIGLTQPQLQAFAAANNALITSLTAWQGPGATLFGAILEPNVLGRTWRWYFDTTAANFYATALATNSRPISISQYLRNGVPAFAGVQILNVGPDQRAWWMYHGIAQAQMDALLVANRARLYTLLPDGGGTFTCVMIGDPGVAWWYLTGVTGQQLVTSANNHGARVFDALRTGATVTGVMLGAGGGGGGGGPIGQRMRALTDGVFGFYCKRVNGAVTQAFQEQLPFEPASTLKTLHHFHAIEQVDRGNAALPGLMNVFLATIGSCPQDQNPFQESLDAVLRAMMRQSDNNRTQAVVARFGLANLNATAVRLGMAATVINHRIGCPLGLLPNQTTLQDVGILHEHVANGGLGNLRPTFYDIMLHDVAGYAFGAFAAMLQQEAGNVGLNAAQLAAFSANTKIAYKGGSYTLPGPQEHRTWGAWVSLPHCAAGNLQDVEYVTGVFVNHASNGNNALAAINLGAAEVLRAEVRAAMQTWLACVPGAIIQIGVGCRGGNGQPLVLRGAAGGRAPVIGGPLALAIEQAAPNSFGMLEFGSSTQNWNGTPLPLALDFAGMRGCQLYVSPDAGVPVFSDALGDGGVRIVLPLDPALVGSEFHNQVLMLDPAANQAGVVASNGLTTRVGG